MTTATASTPDALDHLATLPLEMQSRLCRFLPAPSRKTILAIAIGMLAEGTYDMGSENLGFSNRFVMALKARLERARGLEEAAHLQGLLHIVNQNQDTVSDLRRWILALHSQARAHAAILELLPAPADAATGRARR